MPEPIAPAGISLAGCASRHEEAPIATALVHVRPQSHAAPDLVSRIARAGLDGILLAEGGGEPERAALFSRADAAGLTTLALHDPTRFALDDTLVEDHPRAFLVRRDRSEPGPIDPRRPAPRAGYALLRLEDSELADEAMKAAISRLATLLGSGVKGIVFDHVERADAGLLAQLVAAVRARRSGAVVGARVDVAGAPALAERLAALSAPLDLVIVESRAWPHEARATLDALDVLRPFGRPVLDLGDRVARPGGELGAAASAGLVVDEAVLESEVDVTGLSAIVRDGEAFAGATAVLPAPGADIVALVRADAADLRTANRALLVLANPRSHPVAGPGARAVGAAAGLGFVAPEALGGVAGLDVALAAGEVRRFLLTRATPIAEKRFDGRDEALVAASRPRIIIEDVTPRVEDGAFPVKRVVGDSVTVEADIFADGHEVLGARLVYRAEDEDAWQSAPFVHRSNDRWVGTFVPARLGRYRFAVEAWWDRYGTLRRDLGKKRDAGVVQDVDCAEGRLMVEAARKRANAAQKAVLGAALAGYKAGTTPADRAEALLDSPLADEMEALERRDHLVRSPEFPLDCERLAARFSSWYELFPRSQTDSAARHGTFADVIERLPAVRAMGFDTLYFPPIHPIGAAYRKGKNNSTTAGPGDPGSPYAIGSAQGGHDAVHPELGTLEDFLALVAAARGMGLEIALDFAIQCSPDHPWLKAHPGWFDWRPDGTIKYAENPPKKYQDIVNVDFYAKDAIPSLWLALRDVVRFWIENGVTVFRVDNPHTKPFAFWEWMIADIRRVHPEAIFLAEAFTRPKVMYRLAKVGFSQSYTYFTWRNHKTELADYLTELSTTAPREFFRPHFFVNTPDINPTFLHQSGPAGFKIRAALAATLSGLMGIYSGFELCESAPVPGREEYLDSEKYEIRPRDWKAPGNIIADITLLNRLRRHHPELQTHLDVTFHNAFNDSILYYAKGDARAGTLILVAVSLDPYHAQDAAFEIPLWEFGLADHAGLAVEDLVTGHHFTWHGKHQHMRIEPDRPYRIWKVKPAGGEQ